MRSKIIGHQNCKRRKLQQNSRRIAIFQSRLLCSSSWLLIPLSPILLTSLPWLLLMQRSSWRRKRRNQRPGTPSGLPWQVSHKAHLPKDSLISISSRAFMQASWEPSWVQRSKIYMKWTTQLTLLSVWILVYKQITITSHPEIKLNPYSNRKPFKTKNEEECSH